MQLCSQTPSEEEASIHTAEMITMKEIKEREDIRWVIYTLVELNAVHAMLSPCTHKN